jgi:hypothetical protein
MKTNKVVKKIWGAPKNNTDKNYGFYLKNYGYKNTVFLSKDCLIPENICLIFC